MEGYFEKANEFYRAKDYTKALSLYKKAIKENDNKPNSLYNAGVCYIKIKEYSDALELIKQALELGYQESKVYFNAGFCYTMLNDNKNAYLNFNIAWSLDNTDEDCEKAIKLTESKLWKES